MSGAIAEKTVEELKQKIHDGISPEILNELCGYLEEDCCDSVYYELTSIAVINSLKKQNKHDKFEQSQWYREGRINCYQKLLKQDNCLSPVHIFLATITSHQSSGHHWVIPAIAKEFQVVLKPLYENGLFYKNAILCLVVVREFIVDWISQKEISDLHLEFFPEFTRGDLSLPYGNVFESSIYYRNVIDLKSYINHTNDVANLKLYQLLLIDWLFYDEQVYPYNLECLVNLIRDNLSKDSGGEYKIQLSAAKSLLAHHISQLKGDGDKNLTAVLKEFNEDGALLVFLDYIAHNQNQLKKSLSGNTPTESARKVHTKTYQTLMSAANIITGRTGFNFFSPRRRLKVAVCVSGQLRGYRQAFESWKKSILVGVDYDIYVHSWKSVGNTNAEPFRKFLPFEGENFKKGYREYCMIFGFEHIQQEYPTLFKYLKQSTQVTEDEIRSFYGAKKVVLEDDSMSEFGGFTNSDKMHYKINACNKLMKSSNQEYDLVIRIRPDFGLSFVGFKWDDILDWCRADSIIFSDAALGSQYMTCLVGDQFALGSPQTMDIYADTWNIYPKFFDNNLFGCKDGFEGHVSIAMNCWVHNIKVQKLPMKKLGLLDPSVMLSTRISEAIKIDADKRNSIWDQKFLGLIEMDISS